jgi:hypothetical protein
VTWKDWNGDVVLVIFLTDGKKGTLLRLDWRQTGNQWRQRCQGSVSPRATVIQCSCQSQGHDS